MAKLALINREVKRAALVKKYAAKRAALEAAIADQSKTEEERYEARLQLQKLPRNAIRLVNVTVVQSLGVHVACIANSACAV